MNISSKQVNQLLKLIKDPKERNDVRNFLRDVEKKTSKQPTPLRSNYLKRKSAKKALDIICRIGLEIGKHKAIETFFSLLD